MENRKKGLIIAVILLLAVAAAYFVIIKMNETSEAEETAADDTLIISSVDSDQITAISYETAGEKLSFIKEDGQWYAESDRDFPVLQDSLTSMANELGAVSAIRKLEDPEDLSEYGLDDPVLTVHYESAEGKSADIIVGDTNAAVDGCYLQVSGDDAVYIVASDFADVFKTDLYEMADMEDFPTILSDDITSVKIEAGNHTLQLITDENDSSGWTVKENGETADNCASSAITKLVNTVTGITFKQDIDYRCEDLVIYGLDQPQAAVTIDYTENVTVEDDASEEETTAAETEKSDGAENADEAATETESETVAVAKQAVLLIGARNEAGDYYVCLDGSVQIHLLSEDTVSQLMEAKASDMIDSTIITGTLSTAVGMDMTIGDKSWTLEKKTVAVEAETEEISGEEDSSGSESAEETEAEPETEEKWYAGSQEIQLVDLSGAYSDLSQMKAEKILEESTEPKGEETVSIILKWNDGKETVVTFTAYDSSFQLATVDGVSRKLVNRRDVEKLIEDMEVLLQ